MTLIGKINLLIYDNGFVLYLALNFSKFLALDFSDLFYTKFRSSLTIYGTKYILIR